jgi:GNAT superfamily N-acetyltransferase
MKPRKRAATEEIDDISSPWFARAVRLMEETFPPEERMDVRDLADTLAEKRLGVLRPANIHLLVAHEEDQVLGFCQGWYIAVSNVCFVSYLLVRRGLKGRRLGAVLRQRLIRECQRDALLNRRKAIWAVVGEVEEDNPWLHTLVRSRGAIALDIDYRQPSLGPNQPPVRLILYVQRLDYHRKSLKARDVRSLVYSIYRRVYRIQFPVRNPSFRQILKSMEGRHRIGQRRLSAPAARRSGPR